MKYCLSSIYKNTFYECENQVTISGITCLLKCLSRFIIPYTKSPFEGWESTFKTYSCFQQYFEKPLCSSRKFSVIKISKSLETALSEDNLLSKFFVLPSQQ